MECATLKISVSAHLAILVASICDVPLITECDVNPCQNGGNCSMIAVTPVCNCPDDFSGPRCEIPCS